MLCVTCEATTMAIWRLIISVIYSEL